MKQRVIAVIQTSLGIEFVKDTDFKYSLLDPRIGLQPRDLLVVFFELEKAFRIKFTEADILKRRFDELDNIVEAVWEKVDK